MGSIFCPRKHGGINYIFRESSGIYHVWITHLEVNLQEDIESQWGDPKKMICKWLILHTYRTIHRGELSSLILGA